MRRLCLLLLTFAFVAGTHASEPVIPNLWDSREQLAKPDVAEMPRLRFLTTIDFPPFNFLDATGRLSGFHVDLARAICAELGMADRCQIQALPWDELPQALKSGAGEAILAGIAINTETRTQYAFSRAYMQLPGRFVMGKGTALAEPLYATLKGKRVGVATGSAHERALRGLFPGVSAVAYDDSARMLAELREGKIDAVFGDGMRLSFWLAGSDSAACCRFAGGPYLFPAFFGTGMAVAARAEDEKLVSAFDFALREISAKGVFAELYLRYFPVSFF